MEAIKTITMNRVSKKTVLLLGSGGNLGQDLIRVFSKQYNVVCTDKNELDITKRGELSMRIAQLSPDIIINASAYNFVDKCEGGGHEYDLAKQINGYSVGYLAEIASSVGATLIHYSTDYIFDGKDAGGYDECSRAVPINNYGRSKLLGEKLILDVADKDNSFKYYIIRTSKLFGKPGVSNVSKKSFFDTMLDLSGSKDRLSVVDGELSCFTYTKDLAVETEKMISGKIDFGIYHIVNSGSCTWFDGAKYLFEIIKKDVDLIPISSGEFSRPAKRPICSILLNTKLKPLRSWKEALRGYLKI